MPNESQFLHLFMTWHRFSDDFILNILKKFDVHHKLINIECHFVGSVTITRECLSTLSSGFRTDLPADRYEGCRPAAQDVRLAHYVFNNTIKELDIRRDYFDSTTFCYCFLDHRCNGSTSIKSSIWSYSIGMAIALVTILRLF